MASDDPPEAPVTAMTRWLIALLLSSTLAISSPVAALDHPPRHPDNFDPTMDVRLTLGELSTDNIGDLIMLHDGPRYQRRWRRIVGVYTDYRPKYTAVGYVRIGKRKGPGEYRSTGYTLSYGVVRIRLVPPPVVARHS